MCAAEIMLFIVKGVPNGVCWYDCRSWQCVYVCVCAQQDVVHCQGFPVYAAEIMLSIAKMFLMAYVGMIVGHGSVCSRDNAIFPNGVC